MQLRRWFCWDQVSVKMARQAIVEEYGKFVCTCVHKLKLPLSKQVYRMMDKICETIFLPKKCMSENDSEKKWYLELG